MSFVSRNEIVKVIITDSIPQSDLTYLQEEPKISQLISYNTSFKGGKIVDNASTTDQLIKVLTNL